MALDGLTGVLNGEGASETTAPKCTKVLHQARHTGGRHPLRPQTKVEGLVELSMPAPVHNANNDGISSPYVTHLTADLRTVGL